MGKRSDKPKIPKDKYYTWDARAYAPMAYIFQRIETYVEPCAGCGDMVAALMDFGLTCVAACDIAPEERLEHGRQGIYGLRIAEASYETMPAEFLDRADCIITNPPWTRSDLHPFIAWCIATGKPAWLLIDSNWAMTKQARPYLKHCSHIVPTARLKWIPDTTDSAKDDTAWYRFQAEPCDTILLNQDQPDPGFLPEFTRRDERPMLHELI